jgi:hypothetical protein
MSKEISDATNEYRKSEDIFELWLDDYCTRGVEFITPAADLLTSFIDYSKWKGTTSTKLGRMLFNAGFIRDKSNGLIRWRGLGLLQAAYRPHWQEKEDLDRPF